MTSKTGGVGLGEAFPLDEPAGNQRTLFDTVMKQGLRWDMVVRQHSKHTILLAESKGVYAALTTHRMNV